MFVRQETTAQILRKNIRAPGPELLNPAVLKNKISDSLSRRKFNYCKSLFQPKDCDDFCFLDLLCFCSFRASSSYNFETARSVGQSGSDGLVRTLGNREWK